MRNRFRDRTEAGKLLASQLTAYADRSDVLVLGLPRGGIPVAYEVATALHVPLDICLVRKLGVPHQRELAMGAIAPGDIVILNNDVLQSLAISQDAIQQVVDEEKQELERRERVYRGDRPLPDVRDQVVILVDDGIATSSTLRAAIATLQQQHPKQIIVAVPVAPPSVCEALKELVDEVICWTTPDPMSAIGMWYQDFSQTTDKEVCDLLERSIQQTTKTGQTIG